MDFLLHKLLLVSNQNYKNQRLRKKKSNLKKYCIKGKQITSLWKGNKSVQTIFYDSESCGMPHVCFAQAKANALYHCLAVV